MIFYLPLKKINNGRYVLGEDKLGYKDPTSHRIFLISTTFILCGLVPHLNQVKKISSKVVGENILNRHSGLINSIIM